MLLTVPLKKLLYRIPSGIGLAVNAVLFVLTRHVSKGYVGLPFLKFELPKELYWGYFSAFFGFPHDEFFSTDYFALFPWFFLFLCGLFLYRLTEKRLTNAKFLTVKIPVLDFIGRHSLLIYLLHQPIIYAVLYIMFMIIK